MNEADKQRFCERIETDERTGCHNWTGSCSTPGYGQFHWKGKQHSTHRVAWEMSRGAIPENVCVLHKCDNRRCVNPDHLFLGSHADNMHDKIAKGRSNCVRGERHSNAKLTENMVREIKWLLNFPRSISQIEIGKRYGVSYGPISQIKMGKTWRHVI